MLFNSYEFILIFLPSVIAIFALLSKYNSRKYSLGFLAVASLFFYSWWNPSYLLLISLSLVFNYFIGHKLQKNNLHKNWKYTLLGCGIIFNLGLLGYYKYGGFITIIINDIYNSNLIWKHVVLPLAISFFTFQQIAYLIDSAAGRVKQSSFLDYTVFVTFFPQLIAGPIVHHKEMMPQFSTISLGINRTNLQIGVALFAIGLFKKVMLADPIASYVSPIYAEAAHGSITFFQAWIAALGFTLQIYFDFSGYSDMALGAARIFGIVLPVNFNSPLKASNIIDFWSRWHITLTRFLTAYIFTPLAIRATRKAAKNKNKKALIGRTSQFFSTLAIPTLLTMFLSGLWHGAGYQYLVWGSLHGCFLIINHAWRAILPRFVKDKKKYERKFRPLGVFITLLAVCFAMLFFRAQNLDTGYRMATSLIGLNGISIPEGIFVHLGSLKNILLSIGVGVDATAGSQITYGIVYCFILLFLTLIHPNSLDIMRKYKPAIGYSEKNYTEYDFSFNNQLTNKIIWQPTRPWAVLIGIALAFGIMSLQSVSVFLYWQF